MSVTAGVFGALPPYRYSQHELTDTFVNIPDFAGYEDIVRQLHASAKVNSRHLVLPLHEYPQLNDFGEANEIFLDKAVDLGVEALVGALEEAGLAPEDLDVFITTTVTAWRCRLWMPGSPGGWGCARTCAAYRCSDSAVWPGRREWPGCMTGLRVPRWHRGAGVG